MDPKVETLFWAAGAVVFIVLSSWAVAAIAQWVAARVGLSQNEQRKVFWGFLFASPWIVGFLIFVVGPSLASLYYSFTDYRLGQDSEWVGMENYRELIQASGRDGRNFKRAMFNSLYYAIVGVPLQIGTALAMALLLNTTVRGVRMFRLIFYMPVILAGGPAILLAWRYMLGSNGGFVNTSLSNLAENFFLFNWLYRAFIFVVEGFNGFFIGLTNGDPTGPLNFFFPAFIGLVIVVLLLRGDWSPGKRDLAQRTVEIIAFCIGGLLVAVGLVAEPIDISWTFIWALIVLLGYTVNMNRGQTFRALVWQRVGLGLLMLGFVLTVLSSPAEGEVDRRLGYLTAIAASSIPIVFTFLHDRLGDTVLKQVLFMSAAVLMGVVFIRMAPSQFGDGKAEVLVDYLTLQSALELPEDSDYLNEGYGANTMESVWLFGAVVAVMMGTLVLEDNPQARRVLLIGSVMFFGLIAVSSAMDGIRYFRAYDTISETTGQASFHFARFRDATSAWPDSTHRPKWLESDLWVKPSLILINMWSAGAGMLIFLAALKGVPSSFYEAAKVDGASRLQRFFKITLPMISPAMFYNLVIGMIAALQTFEAVYILRSTETETSVMSAAYYLYQRTFLQANIGEGSAISWLLAVIIVMLTILQFRYSRWVNYEV